MLWLGDEYFQGNGIAAIRGRISTTPCAVQSYTMMGSNQSIPRVHACFPRHRVTTPNAHQPIDGRFRLRRFEVDGD